MARDKEKKKERVYVNFFSVKLSLEHQLSYKFDKSESDSWTQFESYSDYFKTNINYNAFIKRALS